MCQAALSQTKREDPHALGRELLGDPGQEGAGHRADRPPVSTKRSSIRSACRQPQPVAGQRLRLGIGAIGGVQAKAQGLARGPGVQGRLRQAGEPDLVGKAERPARTAPASRISRSRRLFYERRSGSGLVSQRLARFQPTPRRNSAWRIVSPDSTLALSPCACATCASRVSVQVLLAWPKARGDWCRIARSRSRLAAVEHRGGALGPRRALGQRRQAAGVEGADGVAHGLAGAAKAGGDRPRRLAGRARQHDLGPAQGERALAAPAGLELGALRAAQLTNEDGRVHPGQMRPAKPLRTRASAEDCTRASSHPL